MTNIPEKKKSERRPAILDEDGNVCVPYFLYTWDIDEEEWVKTGEKNSICKPKQDYLDDLYLLYNDPRTSELDKAGLGILIEEIENLET